MPELEAAIGPDRCVLLIDLGNSRVKWIGGVWHALSQNWDLDVTAFGEGSLADLETALDSGAMMPPEEVLLCSVAEPKKVHDVEQAIALRSSAPIRRLGSKERSAGILNAYPKPDNLGSDRWMAIVGAARHHGLPVVVMDLGTATTLDAVDADGRHRGGLIFPGPLTMLESLQAKTDISVDPVDPEKRFKRQAGKAETRTQAAIEGGIASAQVGALGRFVDWFTSTLGPEEGEELRIVVTGGGASSILLQPDYQPVHDPLLVFKGMLICWQDERISH